LAVDGTILRTTTFFGVAVDAVVDVEVVEIVEDMDMVRCATAGEDSLAPPVDVEAGVRFVGGGRGGVLVLAFERIDACEGGRGLRVADLGVVPVVRTLDVETVDAVETRRVRLASAPGKPALLDAVDTREDEVVGIRMEGTGPSVVLAGFRPVRIVDARDCTDDIDACDFGRGPGSIEVVRWRLEAGEFA